MLARLSRPEDRRRLQAMNEHDTRHPGLSHLDLAYKRRTERIFRVQV